MQHLRGLTLLEMLMSLSLGIIIMTASLMMGLGLQRQLNLIRAQHQQLNRQMLVVNVLSKGIQLGQGLPMMEYINDTHMDFDPRVPYQDVGQAGSAVLRVQGVNAKLSFTAINMDGQTLFTGSGFSQTGEYYLVYNAHQAELVQIRSVTKVANRKKISLAKVLHFPFKEVLIAPILQDDFFIAKQAQHESELYQTSFGKNKVALVSGIDGFEVSIDPQKMLFKIKISNQSFQFSELVR